MTTHHVPVGTLALAGLSGVLIAAQSRANGELAHRLGSGPEASLISFGSGFAVLIIAALLSPRMRTGLLAIRAAVRRGALPRWQTLAGTGGAVFVLIQAHTVPLIGVAVFSVGMIGGQSAASLLVDRLGLRSGVRHHVTPRRIVTAVVTVAAVLVSVSDRIDGSAGWVTLLAVLSGAIVAVQRALNAHITDYSEHGYATTWLNFASGTALLAVVAAFSLDGFSAPPVGPTDLWMYTGGTIGVVYIAIAAVVVQRIGVLMFTATGVGGQLVGSLLLDLLAPTAGVSISANLFAGIALSMVGIAVGTLRGRRRPA